MLKLGLLLKKHLFSHQARPAVRWINRFAVVACALGLCAWLTTMNVMEGLQREIRAQNLAAKAHILLEGPLREDLQELANSIQEKHRADIRDIRVKLQMEGLIEPLRDGKIFTGSGVIIEGSSEVEPGFALIGAELSNVIQASTMDSFRLRNVWRLEGAPLEVQFKGTQRTELFDVDRFHVWVSQKDLEEWLGASGYKSRIEIYLNNPYKSQELLAEIQKQEKAFVDWRTVDSALWYSLNLERKAMAIALFFVVLFGALAVSSSISLRIAEKRREIGLLRALGATPSDIFWLFELEALILGAFSLLIGLVLAGAASWAIANWGMLPSFFYSQNLPVDWSWSRAFLLYFLSLLTVGLASYIPARRLFAWDINSLLRS
jgi:ABC-type lipoprotein release transport system permease subunit